jgi:DNA-binding MarR family transcriptional regulator
MADGPAPGSPVPVSPADRAPDRLVLDSPADRADGPTDSSGPRDLAVVLHDLAWLLPRTIGLAAARQDPLPASELEVMRLLARRPGLSVNDVAHELGMQPSNASTAIRSLIARGTLQRRPDTMDGRVVRLEPTPEAYAARDRRERSWGEALTTVLATLSPPDRQRLIETGPVLRLLAARLSGEAPPDPAALAPPQAGDETGR